MADAPDIAALAQKVVQAIADHKARTTDYDHARKGQTAALNHLTRMQEEFDDAVRRLREGSPEGRWAPMAKGELGGGKPPAPAGMRPPQI